MTRKCGDMTYASYLARRRGECEDQRNERKQLMKIQLANGLWLEGTASQLVEAATKLGQALGNDGTYYLSQSRGLIRIDQMDQQHVRNALLKLHREWVSTFPTLNDRQLSNALTTGNQNATFLALVRRLKVLSTF